MTPESFTYWLQGFVELSESTAVPNEQQWLMIKDHLKLVFDKKTPDHNTPKKTALEEYMEKMKPVPDKRLSDHLDITWWKPEFPYQVTC